MNELSSRDTSIGFAERTRKNLLAIERFSSTEDVHVVTQLVNSLLGLIVFPWERTFSDHIKSMKLTDPSLRDWPRWTLEIGQCQTLGDLIRYLRNGTSHGHIEFSSDSRRLEEVTIRISNYKSKARAPNFVANIRADRLRDFCLNFTKLVFDAIG